MVQRSSRIATREIGAVALTVTLVLLPAADARADLELGSSTTFGLRTLREMPAMRLDSDVGLPSRTLPAQARVANRDSLAMIGGGLDFTAVIDDRYRIPFLGFAVFGAVGDYAPTLSSVDGSIARLRRSTALNVEGWLPGFGARVNLRRWMVAGDVRFGVGFLLERMSVVSGAVSADASGIAVTPIVDVTLLGCRRLDPEQRVCLQVSPRAWDFGAVNGLFLGLRWELGR